MNTILGVKRLVLGLFLLLNVHLGMAQDTLSTKQMLVTDFKNVFGGVKHSYTRPLHWERKDFLTAGSILLGTAALYTFDEDSSTGLGNKTMIFPTC